MKDKNLFVALFFSLLMILSCKEDHRKSDNNTLRYSEVKNQEKNESFEPFIEKGDNFTFKDYELVFNNSTGNFTLLKQAKNLGEIKIGETNYEGPGFKAYISQQNQIDNIIIEATADVGTAWYFSVVIEKGVLVNQFLIEEPRSDSEKYSLDQFIILSLSNNSLNYKFKKDLVAKYSKIPQGVKSDNNYYYITKPIKEDYSKKSSVVKQYIAESDKKFNLFNQKSFDINSDGIDDHFLVLKTKEEFNSDSESSKKSQIVAFISENGSFRKYVNSTIFPNNSNDQFDEISFKNNKLMIKLFNEIPNVNFIEKTITFEYKNQNLVLSNYSIMKGDDLKTLNISKTKTVQFENFNLNDSIYN